MPADGILAARSRARISASPASRAATQNLADFTDTIYPQSEARHDPGIHGRGPRWVIRVVPAIPACPVRPKSGHSANARVYEHTHRGHVAARVVFDAGTTPTIRILQQFSGKPEGLR